jgi:hypothetical protein
VLEWRRQAICPILSCLDCGPLVSIRPGALIIDGLPVQLRPIVQVIDGWFTARRLAE